MIRLYSVNHCYSSRKAREWLISYKIPFIEINISKDNISITELIHILSLTENGTDDIILEYNEVYKKYKDIFEQSPLSEALYILQKNSSIIRTPIIVDDSKLQVGFTKRRMSKFLPRFHKHIYNSITYKKNN